MTCAHTIDGEHSPPCVCGGGACDVDQLAKVGHTRPRLTDVYTLRPSVLRYRVLGNGASPALAAVCQSSQEG